MLLELLAIKEINKPPEIPQPKPQATVQVESTKKPKTIKKKPPEVKVVVKSGDTLIKIAKKHKTTWKRIYYKNKKIKNPDDIKVGVVLILPSKHEKLKKRTFYHPEPKQAVETPKIARSGTYANDMTAGYCTFWAKSQRPDLPTGLGNANSWYSRASAWGLPVGSSPRVGAVATTTRGAEGHVSIVEKIKGSQIYVSEMNVQGWNVLSYAWYPSGDYLYIY